MLFATRTAAFGCFALLVLSGCDQNSSAQTVNGSESIVGFSDSSDDFKVLKKEANGDLTLCQYNLSPTNRMRDTAATSATLLWCVPVPAANGATGTLSAPS